MTAVTIPFAAGCAPQYFGPKTGIGAAAGAAAGGFVGAAAHGGTEGLLGGALLGGLAGGAIGGVLDQQDRAYDGPWHHDRYTDDDGYDEHRHHGPPKKQRHR